MSDMNNLYNNFPDKSEKKRRRKKIYSAKDFLPGKIGVLAKLLTSFIIYMIATGFTATILSANLYLNQMFFLAALPLSLVFTTWATSVLMKDSKNIVKLLPVFVISVVAYFLSPYGLLLTFFLVIFNFVIGIIVTNKLSLPEKIAFSQNLIVGSCMFFCGYQLLLTISFYSNEVSQSLKPVLMTVGVVWIIISLFILNIMNVNRNSDSNNSKASLFRGNIVLTAVFAGLAILIANIGAVKDFLFNVLRSIILFLVGSAEETEAVEETVSQQSESMDLSGLLEESEPSLLAKIMEIVFTVLLVIIGIIALFFLIKIIYKAVKKLINNIFDYLKENDRATAINRYKDKEESVFDKTQFSINIKSGWEKFKKRVKRKPKYSDMKTNQERIRFLYRKILGKDKEESESYSVSMTARDRLIDENATIEANLFASGYEKARYSKHDVSNDEVEAAISVTEKME